MEKAKPKAKRTKSLTKVRIVNAYKAYLMEHGKKPATVYHLTDGMGHGEEEFYKFFPDFTGIDKYLWHRLAENTLKSLHAEPVYAEYNSREKLLAFYYTLMEIAKKDRSYFKLTFRAPERPAWIPEYLKGFKQKFDSEVKSIIGTGIEHEEIVSRPIVGSKYHEAVWLQFVFIMRFWLRDTSKDFEKTDAAIEKSVNLAFELLGKGPLDMMLDFGKFLYQNR